MYDAVHDLDYLGPAALNRAFTLVRDSRDGARRERLEAVGVSTAVGAAIPVQLHGSLSEASQSHQRDQGPEAGHCAGLVSEEKSLMILTETIYHTARELHRQAPLKS